MPQEEPKPNAGRWMKAHHINWLAWILIVVGVMFAIAMLWRISQP